MDTLCLQQVTPPYVVLCGAANNLILLLEVAYRQNKGSTGFASFEFQQHGIGAHQAVQRGTQQRSHDGINDSKELFIQGRSAL